jgi:hypothetical protein
MEQLEGLSIVHWRNEGYTQRMTSSQWRIHLLAEDDKIVFRGHCRRLVAVPLGAGIMEISKAPKVDRDTKSDEIEKYSHLRGHPIIHAGHKWVYKDTGEDTANNLRPCNACGLDTGTGPNDGEPCLGLLPGVMNACCGHGVREDSYVQFTNGMIIEGFVLKRDETKGGE